MHEADDVVEPAVDDRVTGPGLAAGGAHRLGDGQVDLEGTDVEPRDHDLPDRAVTGVEDLGDEAPLVEGQLLVLRDEVTQLLLGDDLAALPRVAARQPDDEVAAAAEQPDERAGQPGERVHGDRGHPRDAFRPLQGDALGRQLAEHERHVGDDHCDGDEREGGGERRRHAEPDQPDGHWFGERDGADGRREEARERDADLHGGQEPVRVLDQPRGLRAAVSLLRQP